MTRTLAALAAALLLLSGCAGGGDGSPAASPPASVSDPPAPKPAPRADTCHALAFSKVAKPLEKAYDWYSFKVLPRLGKLVAGDDASYRYLAESIRMHPGQEELKSLMQKNGFGHVDYHNMTGGIVALHVGIKC